MLRPMPSGYRSSGLGFDGDPAGSGCRRSVVGGPGAVAAPGGASSQLVEAGVLLLSSRIRRRQTRLGQVLRAAVGLVSCLGLVVLFATLTGCGDTASSDRAAPSGTPEPTTADTSNLCPTESVPAPAGGQSTGSGAIGGRVTPSPTVRHQAGLPSDTAARPATPILTTPPPGTTETCAPAPGVSATTDAPGKLPGSPPAAPPP
jgi:hypothetical protein